MQKYYADNTER